MVKNKKKEKRDPTFIESLLLTAFSLALLMYNIFVLGKEAHIPLIVATSILSVYAIVRLGLKWDDIMGSIRNGIMEIATTFLVFGIIGMMIATWIMGGIVPTLIYYGLDILNPKFFLVMTMLICSVVSAATGSSWTTVGTMGVVFLGIGASFGVPMPVTAGAAISGAYFGDAISPLSDTTNLAPAISGANLFDHVRHTLISGGISLVLSGTVFFFMGLKYGGEGANLSLVVEIQEAIASNFYISPILLIVPCVVILLGALKMPAVPSMFAGVFLGAICCSVFQGYDLGTITSALNDGFVFECENEMLASLLSGGGIQSMMWSMSLTICAICFGSVLDATNILYVLAKKVLSVIKTTRALLICTILTGVGTNIITGDQYLGIIIPGKMYRKSYEEYGLAPQNLSRALEDSATVTSPIVPWSSCAAVMVGALGIPAVEYMPYSIFCFMTPLVSIFLAVTGISIIKTAKERNQNTET